MNEGFLLDIENLWVYYDRIAALKEVSLKVKKGEIVALLGANGAGKTTTLMSISRILNIEQGKINYKGTDIINFSPENIVSMGIRQIPERKKIFRYLKVEDNLLMGAYLEKNKIRIKHNLEKVYDLFPPLWERRNKLGDTLSGGEQQMLAIGMSLMSEVELLLLDEPSLGLAPKFVEETFQIIEEVNKKGTSILLVEQNAYMALEIAHRGYVLEAGKVKFEDRASDLLKNPAIKEAYLGG
ncbi:MAG: ABC transporter ATP-binding protein [bacterium]|nr:ABC transporter ATP-binding protein [bacterium]